MSITFNIEGELDEDEVIDTVINSSEFERAVDSRIEYEVESQVEVKLDDIDFGSDVRDAVFDHFGRWGEGTSLIDERVREALQDSNSDVVSDLNAEVSRLANKVDDLTRKLEAVARAYKGFITDEAPAPFEAIGFVDPNTL